MRILINNPFYYPNMKGGAEQSVKLLAEGLVKQGHEVAVYCVDSEDGQNKVEEYNGVKVFRYTGNKFNIFRFSYEKGKIGKLEKIQQKLLTWHNPECVMDFGFVCKEFKPDIIHSNGTYGMSQFVWKKAHEMGIPVLHTIRDISIVSPVQYGHKVNGIVKIVHHYLTKYTTSYVDAVAAPSQYTLDSSLAPGFFENARRKNVIFNSVSIDENAVMEEIAEKQSRRSSTIKFMYAGRLVYFKGIENMINAFEKLEYEDMELHICGTGEMKEFVRKWAEKDPRIIFRGHLNNRELSNEYKECDVLLVPSVWPEPFGRVVIEGAMHGMPVISGNCGGIPEIYQVMNDGVLYQADNVDELVQQMMKMTKRENYSVYFEEIKKNLWRFSIDAQIDAYLKLYQELI